MIYFVTGATGFIGKRLVSALLRRRHSTVYVLVRPESRAKVEALREFWSAGSRVIPVEGDLTQLRLGIAAADLAELKGKVQHLFHLAAIYDLRASTESQQLANVEGTRHVVEFAETIEAGCLHLTSSIAAAGLYSGVFREDMFAEAEGLDHPYFRTKHDAEAILRRECQRPWRIYRPGLVVGDSRTGETDKIDGPYYFFKPLQRLRDLVPSWVPMMGLEGGHINIVPVDFVVEAMVYIAHRPGLDGKTFHLVDPTPHRVGQVFDILTKAAHGPQSAMRINVRALDLLPAPIKIGLTLSPALRKLWRSVLDDLGIPADVLRFLNWPTRYDCRDTQRVLASTDIRVPPLETYAWRLWDYWERHLDPDLHLDKTLRGRVQGKVVLITGGSSGIGRATAVKLARAGAHVAICARGVEKLQQTAEMIRAEGGEVSIYSCDLTDPVSVQALVTGLLAEHGRVDILINNAGRSIRRAIEHSLDRMHDFERTMALNYFGCVRVTLALLPSMLERNEGQVISISSIGVLANAPRFAAYVASKAALEAFSRCAAAEFADTGLDFTIVNMPLVRTPMIAPTRIYDHAAALTPEQAADLIARAILERPERLATRLGKVAQVSHALSPKMSQAIMNSAFRLFPESAAASGQAEQAEPQSTPEQEVFSRLLPGIHL